MKVHGEKISCEKLQKGINNEIEPICDENQPICDEIGARAR